MTSSGTCRRERRGAAFANLPGSARETAERKDGLGPDAGAPGARGHWEVSGRTAGETGSDGDCGETSKSGAPATGERGDTGARSGEKNGDANGEETEGEMESRGGAAAREVPGKSETDMRHWRDTRLERARSGR